MTKGTAMTKSIPGCASTVSWLLLAKLARSWIICGAWNHSCLLFPFVLVWLGWRGRVFGGEGLAARFQWPRLYLQVLGFRLCHRPGKLTSRGWNQGAKMRYFLHEKNSVLLKCCTECCSDACLGMALLLERVGTSKPRSGVWCCPESKDLHSAMCCHQNILKQGQSWLQI